MPGSMFLYTLRRGFLKPNFEKINIFVNAMIQFTGSTGLIELKNVVKMSMMTNDELKYTILFDTDQKQTE